MENESLHNTETPLVEASSDTSEAGPRVIYDKEDNRGRITVFEDCNKLKALMKIKPVTTGERFYIDDIMFIISNLGIITGIKEKEIDAVLTGFEQTNSMPEEIIIAEGRPAVSGNDAALEFLFDRSEPYVNKDQKLLRITGPMPGVPGENIYGELIHPAPGKLPVIISGDHVIENEAGEFFSEIFGKVLFTNNSLAVEKVLLVKISHDAMEASVTYTGAIKLTPAQVRDELYANNITSGIDDHAINFMITAFNESSTPILNFVVARGTPPKQGRNGEIKYLFHQGKGLSLNEYLEDGVIIRGTNVIKSIEKDQEIACIIPHEEPVNGKDIYGRVLPVPKVKKVKLRAGKNVRASEDGLHFYAETGGRPIIEVEKVSINEVLTIAGDLDYSVGNIDFDGVVEINGDVADGFKVKATKSIIIKGIVGASDLEAGLDIQIQGGCNGLNKARIISGGNIEAKYINEFNVQARGDILTKNEIVSSSIVCLGRVYVKFGSIRGGTVCAKKGIESLDIGNDMGVKTTLVPGNDYELDAQCKSIEESIIKNNNDMEELSKRVAPFLKNRELITKLPQDAQHKLKETVQYIKTLQKEKSELNTRKNELLAQSLKDAVPEVVVMHFIYHGVILKIGKSRRVISSVLEGPLRLYEENDRITVEPFSQKRQTKGQ